MLRVFLFAFIGSVVFTRVAITLSYGLGILDQPNERKVHVKPMPLLGGVGVFTAYATALLMNFHFSWKLKGVVIASTLVFLSGLMDDIKDCLTSAKVGVFNRRGFKDIPTSGNILESSRF
jgi:UDP-GlcNAc:undecaprenyl-phosphate/decaprenyl-phosphate GlcNAc-1-phosphate transferase